MVGRHLLFHLAGILMVGAFVFSLLQCKSAMDDQRAIEFQQKFKATASEQMVPIWKNDRNKSIAVASISLLISMVCTGWIIWERKRLKVKPILLVAYFPLWTIMSLFILFLLFILTFPSIPVGVN